MTPFDIVLVPFPFSDLMTVKKRPCLILCVLHPRGLPVHYIVAMMTSNRSGLVFPHDVPVENWKDAGLPKKTIVRLGKVVTIDASLIQKKIGSIPSKDQGRIQASFAKMFSRMIAG